MLISYTSSEEENIPYIFENFLKTLRTTTVLSCLKIPLSSMPVDRFVSCESIVPRFQTSSTFPQSSPPQLVSKSVLKKLHAEEFYYSFY